jgi:cysteinyl-tRNA synthetase
MLKIFNTLGRELQEFKPIQDKIVKVYRCGPTVYWTQHIGNMRGMVMSDLIMRSLKYLGYDVIQVRNYTDVGHLTSDEDEGEDKMEKGAKREGITPQEIAQKYIDQFENDLKNLNALDPEFKPKATDYVQQMINMVQVLLDKGYAYSTPTAIYFDISKFPEYTRLSGQKLEMNKEGEGHGEVDDIHNKRNPQDFAIWFFRTGAHKNAMQYWPSPFTSPEVESGNGFPGWHIECSAMAKDLLGDSIDIHIGGIEHIPVHHTNEIAQSEAANGAKFTNYWLHHEHLDIKGEKISKSLGNGYSLEDLVQKEYDPMYIRYFFLQSHYRSKQNFTFEALDASKTAYERLINLIRNWVKESGSLSKLDESSEGGDFKSDLHDFNINKEYQNKFIQALEEDFNIPKALAVLWEVTKAELQPDDKIATILDFDKVLGLKLEEKLNDPVESKPQISDEAQDLIDQRNLARANKDWAKADQIRNELKEKFGIEVVDSK